MTWCQDLQVFGRALCAIVLGLGGSRLQAQARPSVSSFIQISKPSVTIGDDADTPASSLGQIWSVTLDGDSNTYVLDLSTHSIKVFSPAGKHLASAGRSGRGPGDLASPLGLIHDGRGFLYVVDERNGISLFRTEQGRIEYRSRIATELLPTAACLLKDSLIAYAFSGNRILHVLTPSGAIARSFGEPWRTSANPAINEQMNRVRPKIACDAERSIVYLAQGNGPDIRAYRMDGTLLWSVSLPEYSGTRITEDPKTGALAAKFGPYQTWTITPMPGGVILVQAHDLERKSIFLSKEKGVQTSIDDRGPVTYVLDASTGAMLAHERVGPFIGAIRGTRAVGFDDDPVPLVFVLRVATRRR